MTHFEIGRKYKPYNGREQDAFTVVDRDDRYIYFTKDWVQGKIFREKYLIHPNSETLLSTVWTSSNDVIE